MKRTTILATLLLPLLASSAAGQNSQSEAQVLRLVCVYSYSVEEDGNRVETSGRDLITIVYSPDGRATITKQGAGATFKGKVTEEEIVGETEYVIGAIPVEERILINRFTGAFQFVFSSRSTLVHFGNCEQAERKF